MDNSGSDYSHYAGILLSLSALHMTTPRVIAIDTQFVRRVGIHQLGLIVDSWAVVYTVRRPKTQYSQSYDSNKYKWRPFIIFLHVY